ncbi:MAG: hypothetical protein L3K16_05900 [Thermoplasmata archaeon]|nr:hypothetical protein [Thermoplasmata archaeon]
MTDKKPGLVLDNHYDVPVEFAYSWLTDFYEDDAQRYFQAPEPATVQRADGKVHLASKMAFGSSKLTVTLSPPDRWVADGEMLGKSGTRMATTRIRESVQADGTGTRHHAEFVLWPNGFVPNLMFTLGRGRFVRDMTASFARIKTDLEAEFRATHG